MSDNITFATLNVRGAIKKDVARAKILSGIQLYKINVLLLQETHVNNLKLKNEVDKFFNCKSFWSFGSNDSKGSAILILNNFHHEIIKFDHDDDGRIVKVELKTSLGNVNIISLYAPNDISERKFFF